MCKITHLAERNEWKVQDNHLDAFMDDTSSLPTTNIINDRLKFFLVFFLKKGSTKNLQRSRITGTNSLKDQTQAITSDWPIKKRLKNYVFDGIQSAVTFFIPLLWFYFISVLQVFFFCYFIQCWFYMHYARNYNYIT